MKKLFDIVEKVTERLPKLEKFQYNLIEETTKPIVFAKKKRVVTNYNVLLEYDDKFVYNGVNKN